MFWLIATLFAGFAVLWVFYIRPRRGSGAPLHVKSIFLYPIKTCGGIEVQSARYDRLGFESDRRFLLVSGPDPEEEQKDGKPVRWLTQREYPRLALVQPSLPSPAEAEDFLALLVDAPGMPQLRVRRAPLTAQRLMVKVNDQEVPALHCGNEAAEWFSKYIGRPTVLATILGVEEHKRAIDPVWEERNPEQKGKTSAAFVDDDPFLFIPEESLQELNARLAAEDKVTMRHFRPSVVVAGSGVPFDEDHWERFAILPASGPGHQEEKNGRQEFDVTKPCARCIIPTIDPDKGMFRESREPTVTLRTFRRVGDDVFFGQYAVHRQASGRISVGDRLVVLERSFTENTVASRVLARKAKEEALKRAREGAAQ